MEDAHTPAGYFIAIVAVIGGAFLMPPFPLFIMVVGPLLILGSLACVLLKGKHHRRQEGSNAKAVFSQQFPTVIALSTEELNANRQQELETVSA